MSDKGGLPRHILDAFAKDLRTKRFFEKLQVQAFDILPASVQQIFAAIQQAQITADTAQTTAIQALNKTAPDVLGLVGVPVRNTDALGLVAISVQSENALNLVALGSQSHDLLIPICIEVTP